MNNKAMFEGHLRVYAEVTGYAQALDVARELVLHAQKHIVVDRLHIEPYWKIPEYFGVALFFESVETTIFDTLLESFASGWEPIVRDPHFQDGVWNVSENSAFINPSVRWAHLNISPKPD